MFKPLLYILKLELIMKRFYIRIIYLFILLGFLILNACKSNFDDGKFASFPRIIDMGNCLVTNPALKNCYNIDYILIVDSLLIILDTKDDYRFIKIYNKRTFEPLGGFGRLGQGPNEYFNPFYLRVNKQHKVLTFAEPPKRLIHGFKLDDILQKKEEPNPFFTTRIDSKLIPISSYCFLNDSNLLLSTTADSSIYTLIDTKGTVIKTFGCLNEKKEGLKQYFYNCFFTQYFVYNEEKNEAIYGYQYFDMLNKLNLNNGSISRIYGSNYKKFKPEIMNGCLHNNYAAFYNLKQDSQFVYAPFLGKPFFNVKDYSTNYATEILVFNWDLKPVARLKFPNPIIDFDVDDSNIYVLTNNHENQLLVFSLDKRF